MSLSEKPMHRFIETIRIEEGTVCNLHYHQARLERCCRHFFPEIKPPALSDLLDDFPRGPALLKARIEYGSPGILEKSYTPYTVRNIRSVQPVCDEEIAYPYKSTDRRAIQRLFAQRGEADEVIIVRRGLLTDSSFSNLALFDGHRWLTPAHPLLCGTMRQSLIDRGVLHEADIPLSTLHTFSRLSLINAMLPLGRCVIPLG